MRKCEHRDLGAGIICTARARFRVARIGRKSDAQDSCGRHLAATCTALEEGDGSLVTVEHIRERQAAGFCTSSVPEEARGRLEATITRWPGVIAAK